MTRAIDVINRIPGRQRGTGIVLCLYDRPLYLNESTLALPMEYI